MQVPSRVILAAGLAVVGIGWATWSLSRHGVGRRAPAPPHVEASETVVRTLGAAELDAIPSDATASSEIARAAEAAGERLRLLRPFEATPRTSDLIILFEQSLRGTVAPDFEARCRMMQERGDSWAGPKLADERDRWTTQAELTRHARFGVRQLEVRELFRNGVRLAPTATEEGYATIVSHPAVGRLPTSHEPERDKLDIVEVRLPMEKRQVPVASGGGVSVVLVGYQFAWNSARKQWIPWSICIYMDPNDVHYVIYF